MAGEFLQALAAYKAQLATLQEPDKAAEERLKKMLSTIIKSYLTSPQ